MTSLSLLALASSSLCLSYSIILQAFRHSTYEHISFFHSFQQCLIGFFLFFISFYFYDKLPQPVYFLIITSSIMKMISNYYNFVHGKKFPITNCEGKVYIITGSSAGIGLETAREIARMGGTVILACRSKEKALIASQDILQTTKCSQSKVIILLLDVSDLTSVRNFVKEFHQLGFPLHGLINNAGVMLPERSVNKNGYEMMFTSNHLGHFLLTTLLLNDLEKTSKGDKGESGRIVNVSSSLHRSVSSNHGFNFADIMYERNYSLFGTYAHTKLANVIFTIELNRRLRLKNSHTLVFSVHPGAVLTEVTRSLHPLIRLAHVLFIPFMLLLQKLPSQGAYCSIYAATSPDLTIQQSGEYLFHCKKAEYNLIANNPTTGVKLWEISEKLCEVN